jgi:CO/xanthine dehydrogenase Mo-binding subunit
VAIARSSETRKALGVGEDKVVLRQHFLGGGFGRRLNGDYAVPVALASKALGGKPVKMMLTRPDDVRFDSFRSPSLQRVRMAFDESGKVTAMQHDACAGWPTQVMAGAFMAKGLNGAYDPFAIAGADSWYDVGAQRARDLQRPCQSRFPTGLATLGGAGLGQLGVRIFLDEVAHARGLDPVEWRLRLLDAKGRNAGQAPISIGGALRQAACSARGGGRIGAPSCRPTAA